MSNRKMYGFWIIFVIWILIFIMLLLGQTMLFIDCDFTVKLGLQESMNDIWMFGVVVNKSFGIGDTLIFLPLLTVGLIGFWQNKKWGIWALIGVLGITAYWPVVCLSIVLLSKDVPGVYFKDISTYIFVLSFFSLYGIWCIVYLYKNYFLQ